MSNSSKKQIENLIENGNDSFEKGDIDKALAIFSEVTQLDPKNSMAYNWKGIIYDKKREYEKAIEEFTKAITFDPSNTTSYFRRGLLLRLKKKTDQALADFTQIVKLEPNDATGYIFRGGNLLHGRGYGARY